MSIRTALFSPMLLPVLVLLTVGPQVGEEEPDEIVWEDYPATAVDGSPLKGRLGRLSVPENRTKEDSGEIEIAFVVYESTNTDPGPPIFFLIGGPGADGVDHTASEATNPLMPLIEFGDVVGIDQRGTGQSKPNLYNEQDFTYELPSDEPLTREALIAAQTDAMRRCYEHWTSKGVDLSGYNSRESADDVDAVREALGYDKIITWGTSYGSHLSLAYLRRHAEHVERSVMMKVEGPNHTFKLPGDSQRQLERVHELVANDTTLNEQLPDFLGTVSRLLEQLEQEPVQVTLKHPSGEYQVTVGPLELQFALALQLSHTQSLARIPAVVHSFASGDWTMLGLAGLNLRRGAAESGMAMMMDYSSGATAARLAQIERERRDPENLLSDALAFPYYPESASALDAPDLGDAFRGPLKCDVPVLFVSGELDARTPPSNVEEIASGFSNYAHVLALATGHDGRELQSEEYRELVRAFLRGEEVESCTIELPPVEFMQVGQ